MLESQGARRRDDGTKAANKHAHTGWVSQEMSGKGTIEVLDGCRRWRAMVGGRLDQMAW